LKILPFKIAKPVNESFWIQNDNLPHFYDVLHRHDEFQITLIQESFGNVIAGNQIKEFSPGDIFVFGGGLPHVFKNGPNYYDNDESYRAKSVSVYFEWKVFGKSFLNLPETKPLADFIRHTERGIFFPQSYHQEIAKKITQLPQTIELGRLLLLLQILNLLINSQKSEILATEGLYNNLKETDEKRLDAVFKFTLNEYHRPISLQEVAGISNMTVNSFCRYFKQRTRKSYIDFLTGYRIGQACKLLQTEESGVLEICYRVGFNNLSNFNRKFRQINNCAPKEYRSRQRSMMNS
jgi:AraC-like DNA-binding protein